MDKVIQGRYLIGVGMLLTLLTGCSDKVLDFRNAQFSNGKVYAGQANTPFSGKVTNVPAKLALQNQEGLGRLAEIAAKFKTRSNLNFYTGDVYCIAKVEDGYLDGEVICENSGGQVRKLEVSFTKGTVTGNVKEYDVADKSPVLLASVKDGKLDGKEEIYSTKTKKLVHRAHWDNGIPDGSEEAFDEESGNLIFQAELQQGKYSGTTIKYANNGKTVIARIPYKNGLFNGTAEMFNPENGKIISHEEWSNGVLNGVVKYWDKTGTTLETDAVFKNGIIASASPDSKVSTEICMDAWAKSYRDKAGANAPISDMLVGWADQCRQGKLPSLP